MAPADRGRAICAGLAAAVMVSAVAAVYAKHKSRKLFVELQTLTAERDRLDMDCGRLQIEQSTQAAYPRVETVARDKLAMRMPDPRAIEVVAR